VYGNMWQKTRSILSYMHDNYLEHFEYFYLAGDDTHLIVENLRNYLGLMEEEQGLNATLFAGQLHLGHDMDYFVSGGGGYVMNRLTLKRLVRERLSKCSPHKLSPLEDMTVSACLQKMGVSATDAADARGAQRFHYMDPDLVERCPRERCHGARRSYWEKVYKELWGKKHGYKTGIELASSQSVAFHLLRTRASMKRHHAILYRSCPAGTLLADELEHIDLNKIRDTL